MKIKEEEYAIRRQFTDWLYRIYSISEAPKSVFIMLAKVYQGTYKGQKQPIPAEDLWDMWNRRFQQLQQIHAQPYFVAKHLSTEQTILYDLSILVKKYDSYLRWKEDCERGLNYPTTRKTEELMDFEKLKPDTHSSKEIDINTTISEIWGDIDG